MHINSPFIYSDPLSDLVKTNVYLKLDFLQPGGSFKIRGIAKLCSWAVNNGYQEFISSSGGNAGISTSYAAKKLGIPFVRVKLEPILFILFISFLALARKLFATARRRIAMYLNLRWLFMLTYINAVEIQKTEVRLHLPLFLLQHNGRVEFALLVWDSNFRDLSIQVTGTYFFRGSN